jgi:hypothetical protein
LRVPERGKRSHRKADVVLSDEAFIDEDDSCMVDFLLSPESEQGRNGVKVKGDQSGEAKHRSSLAFSFRNDKFLSLRKEPL